MTAPYIPPRKSLRDALVAANLGLAASPTVADRTATPGYRPPPTPVMSAQTSRPRMTPRSELGKAIRGEQMSDTPMGLLNEMVNPVRQGAQARGLLGDAIQSLSRNRIARGVGQGALGLAAAVPGVPDEVVGGIKKMAFRLKPAATVDRQAWHLAGSEQNPLVDRQRMVMANNRPVGVYAVEPHADNDFWVHSIRSLESGGGRAVLKHLTDAADRSGVTLRLTPQPFGGKGLSAEDLEAWYARHGFQRERNMMVRPPAKTK